MKDQKKKDMVKSQQVENERKRMKTDMGNPRGGFGGRNSNRGGFNRGNYGGQNNNNNHNKSGPYTFGQPNVYSNNRDSYNSNDNKRRRF